VIVLPKRFAGLFKLAGEHDARYSLRGLRLLEYAGDCYRIEVTDGRRLAIVRGPSEELNGLDLSDAPGGIYDFFVPTEKWKEVFRLCPNGGAVALCAGDGRVTLATHGGHRLVLPRDDPRTPDFDAVMPATPPLVRFTLRTDLLAGLVSVADTITDPERRHVEVLYYGPGKPVGLMCSGPCGHTLDALIMPLSGPDD
jgi:hypothetical protein